MNAMNIRGTYDPEADALFVRLAAGQVADTREVSPGVILDFDEDGHLLGMEVLNASTRMPPGLADAESQVAGEDTPSGSL
ncbi:Hypothetical protein HVIM_03231 [Roseomonas mucosa]|jgi:uncharacterized protein YuzE|uniref:Uncharacterized conserved small protein n=1 Tax=Roseomonas mucosa TaxID=207340 RepID=A0A379N3J3_9PROT|nr:MULTISPECIES: DUF2283 domain-containing protein [Roseomonas]MDT8265301.1 DUF2283 domain-containing protein [Roseomonas sp. DSM 102946]MCG7352665.1 DUF2283 domain-containing protein [Roseomonas mucosa]MCG7358206.1 DUF2283 domain-containing protein [Roseomonas mucosa]MDT8291587.1 DUF2283 domain-containing protein [Roseomonas mucosa]MDT8295524.1 DUF2283 domain-containing protein [Roseomonas mucosa]